MKRSAVLRFVASLFFTVALVVGVVTQHDAENESELVKSFRDPDRVDQRWLYVIGFGSASVCLALWAMYDKNK